MRRIAVVIGIGILALVGAIGLAGCGPSWLNGDWFGPDPAYQTQLNSMATACDHGSPSACINYQNELQNQRQAVADYNAAVRADQQAWEAKRLEWAIQNPY